MSEKFDIRLRALEKGSDDLDRYIFQDLQHAREWLANATDEEWRVEFGKERVSKCCGRTISFAVTKAMTVSDFLRTSPSVGTSLPGKDENDDSR